MPGFLKTVANYVGKTIITIAAEKREEGTIVIYQILATLGISFGAIVAIVIPPEPIGVVFVFIIGLALTFITREIPQPKSLILCIVIFLNVLMIAFSNANVVNFLFGLNFMGDWKYVLPHKRAAFEDSVKVIVIDERTRNFVARDGKAIEDYHAVVTKNLSDAGVRVIGFDTIVNTSWTSDEQVTGILIPDQYNFQTNTFESRFMIAGLFGGNTGNKNWYQGTHNELFGDADWVVRNIDLVLGERHVAISLAAYLSEVDATLLLRTEPLSYVTNKGKVKVLREKDKSLIINYATDGIEHISYIDVYNGNWDKSKFRDNIALIGNDTNLVKVPGYPFFLFPRTMMTADVQANAIATLISDSAILETPRKAYMVLIFLLMMINLTWFMKHLKLQPEVKLPMRRFVFQSLSLLMTSALIMAFFNYRLEIFYCIAAIWLTYFSLILCQRMLAKTLVKTQIERKKCIINL